MTPLLTAPRNKNPGYDLLPERDYVTFGYMLSQIRLSIICNV